MARRTKESGNYEGAAVKFDKGNTRFDSGETEFDAGRDTQFLPTKGGGGTQKHPAKRPQPRSMKFIE